MKKDFKHYFQSRQSQFDESPRAEIWEKLQKRLDTESSKEVKSIPLWRKLSIAASFLLVFTVVGTYLYNSGYQKGQNEAIFVAIDHIEDLKPVGNVRFYEELSQSPSQTGYAINEVKENKFRTRLHVKGSQSVPAETASFKDDSSTKTAANSRNEEAKAFHDSKDALAFQDGLKKEALEEDAVATSVQSESGLWREDRSSDAFSQKKSAKQNEMESNIIDASSSDGIDNVKKTYDVVSDLYDVSRGVNKTEQKAKENSRLKAASSWRIQQEANHLRLTSGNYTEKFIISTQNGEQMTLLSEIDKSKRLKLVRQGSQLMIEWFIADVRYRTLILVERN